MILVPIIFLIDCWHLIAPEPPTITQLDTPSNKRVTITGDLLTVSASGLTYHLKLDTPNGRVDVTLPYEQVTQKPISYTTVKLTGQLYAPYRFKGETITRIDPSSNMVDVYPSIPITIKASTRISTDPDTYQIASDYHKFLLSPQPITPGTYSVTLKPTTATAITATILKVKPLHNEPSL